MADSNFSLETITRMNASDPLFPILKFRLASYPELNLLMGNAVTVDNSSLKVMETIDFADAEFLDIGDGMTVGEDKHSLTEFPSAYMGRAIRLPKSLAEQDNRGEDHALGVALQNALDGVNRTFARQFYYGQRTAYGGNAKGFPGLVDFTHPDYVLDAGGTTANTGSSVYLFKNSPVDGIGLFFGHGKAFQTVNGELITQIDSSNRQRRVYVGEITSYPGIYRRSITSLARIKKITADSGKTMSIPLASQLVGLLPVPLMQDFNDNPGGWTWMMSKRSAQQYNATLTPTSATETSAPKTKGSDYLQAGVLPTMLLGAPIIVTSAIKDTEALTL